MSGYRTARHCIWFTRQAASFAIFSLWFSTSSFAATTVRLNEVIRSIFYAPQYVALHIGAFETEGLNITGPKTTWGTQAALTEIVSGNSDIALLGPESALFTREAGPARRLYDFAQLTNGDGTFILAKTPMPDFKVSDLKGKTIVTTGKGSTSALALLHIIRQAGLDPDKDLTIRFIPTTSNIIPSYLEANTTFAQTFEPAIYKAVAENKGYRVASVGSLLGQLPYTAYMASGEFIEKHPDLIQSFTNAIQKGLNWTREHSAHEVAEMIAPDFKDMSVSTIEAVVDEYKKVDIWPRTVVITPDGMKKMSDLMVEGGVVNSGGEYADVVKPEFSQKAAATADK
ncbi:ABC transporter substrate-binding protein [Bradyrhizobium erythrophlei]|jgi:NitT/TauT family transport system substrate-binding protein|uniref:NitT/TauT family transport system substrate-binding protein n=1 Tax=Bradyrhizobium erythrophlei TaxID=1437360 RepID=A0A1M5RAY8_9BRAD|nr:ABC transporter substrate-binding protein [Bradyrhizobium erythrophlei]SHH23338.1 NitT/TauT family transport system substrate-binding protein [Bradyrhizobium erythrophlei]